MATVLLSSVCPPFGEKYGDGFGVSYEGSYQILWAQGIFRTRGTTTQWGIDFIAENLTAPTTTLHYPSMEQFIEEIKKGYDYVGIAFIGPTLHKMIPMSEAVRKYAPKSKIVLGGYGTAIGAEALAPYGDYISDGEGVVFMRELLGEPLDRPLVQPVITQDQTLFSLPVLAKQGYVFAGLGCPNGCDFCATSHYFDRKHVRLLPEGNDILCAIQHLRTIYPDMVNFWISDEDLLLNHKRGFSFLEAMRKSDLPPLSLSIFGSVKALSQYKASELVEMGVDWIWVGYEGLRSGYDKMKGRTYKELFADLHAHGISILASMIIGFDYQTPEIIQEEFEELMALRPTFSQFLIYGPPRGTPLHARLTSEDRLTEMATDLSKCDGFSLVFKHPNIGPEQMSAIQRQLFRDEFERLGPSVYRVVDDWLAGHKNLKDHPAPRVRAKAEKLGRDAHAILPLMPASLKYLSPANAARAQALADDLVATTGPMTWKERLIAKLAPIPLAYTDYKLRNGIEEQPVFTRREYRVRRGVNSMPRVVLRTSPAAG